MTEVMTSTSNDDTTIDQTTICASDDIKAMAEEAGIGIVDGKTQEEDETEEDEKKDDGNKEAEKKKYVDWPFRNIKEPHDNDVLYGRGGGTNHHVGNKIYRKKVEDRKVDYVNCKRLDKPLVALSIIREWRGQAPPGRFLKMDDKTGLWNDVGDKKAREKTSQALRERAPQIRQELEEEKRVRERRERGESTEEDEEEDDATKSTRFVEGKSTRFVEGTNLDGSNKPCVLARDHSLGREYLDGDGGMTLDGFSWQEPVRGNSGMDRVGSQGSYGVERVGSQGSYSQPPMPYGPPRPGMGSYGPPPPQPGPYEHVTSGDRHRHYVAWGRHESWGSAPGGAPPPMGYGYPPSHSGSWGAREHSLGGIPLSHATVSQVAYPTAFDHHHARANSGHWGPHHPPSHPPPYSPSHPPPYSPGPPPYHMSSGPSYPAPPRREYSGHKPVVAPPSPSYRVDPAVASQWSGQDPREIAFTLSGGSSGEEHDNFNLTPKRSPRNTAQTPGSSAEEHDNFNSTPTRSPQKTAPTAKPDIVKRETSNQNETVDTKPDFDGQSVKRAALNRDGSIASNRLKEKYMPGYFDTKKELELLSTNLEQSTLDADTGAPKPAPLTKEERMLTLDMNALDLELRPVALSSTSRSTTIEALALQFDDDPFIKPGQFDRSNLSSMEDLFYETKEDGLSRPPALTTGGRLTTSDFFDIVNEPIADV